MSSGQNDPQEQHGSQERAEAQDAKDGGHTGEGAASALAHMISIGQQRHEIGEADAAAGGRRQ